MITEEALKKICEPPDGRAELDRITSVILARSKSMHHCGTLGCVNAGVMKIDSCHLLVDATNAVIVSIGENTMNKKVKAAYDKFQKTWFCTYHFFWVIGTLKVANDKVICSISASDPDFFVEKTPPQKESE